MDELKAELNLSAEDTAIMDRLFGPRIPDELAEIFEAAKGVDVSDAMDISVALDVLLANVVHSGIGGGFVGGWRLYSRDGKCVVEVCRVKPAVAEAA